MSQRVWRNVSPSTSKQGPIKAVIQFSLKNSRSTSTSTGTASQTKGPSSSSSPTTREIRSNDRRRGTPRSPDLRMSPELRSPVSPSQKEKSKSHRQSPCQHLLVPSVLRASSADPVLSYLTGWWSKDINSYHHSNSAGVFMCDKSTQTIVGVDNTSARNSKGHRRSSSLGQGDLSKEAIKQHLQKTKEGSRQDWSKQQWSPVAGVHCSLSLTAPAVIPQSMPAVVVATNTHCPGRHKMSRANGSSVEALNVEVQKLVLSRPKTSPQTSFIVGPEKAEEPFRVQSIPEGHRAPVPVMGQPSSTRSVDTQTPSVLAEGGVTCSVDMDTQTLSTQADAFTPAHCDSASPARGWAVSCATDVGAENPDNCRPDSHPDSCRPDHSRSDSMESKSSKGDSELDSPEPSKFVCSPKPEKCPFVREPPDGCDKVKVIEETRRPSIKEPLLFCPVKPNQFTFKQSQGSAFYPLMKQYLGDTGDTQGSTTLSGPTLSVQHYSPSMENH